MPVLMENLENWQRCPVNEWVSASAPALAHLLSRSFVRSFNNINVCTNTRAQKYHREIYIYKSTVRGIYSTHSECLPHSIFAFAVRIRMREDNTDDERQKQQTYPYKVEYICCCCRRCCYVFMGCVLLLLLLLFSLHSSPFGVLCRFGSDLFTYDVWIWIWHVWLVSGRLCVSVSEYDIHHYGAVYFVCAWQRQPISTIYIYVELCAGYFDDNHHTRSMH